MTKKSYKYNMNMLKLTRNAFMTPIEANSGDPRALLFKQYQEGELLPLFSFDYYDMVFCLPEPPDKPFRYEDINDTSDRVSRIGREVIASQTLTLYKEEASAENLYAGLRLNAEDAFLSDKPFFAHILVSVHPDLYAVWNMEGEQTLAKTCLEELEKRLHDFQNRTPVSFLSSVFHSLNSGDFCIAIRCAGPELPREIAQMLEQPDEHGAHNRWFYTYVILSMECRIKQEADSYRMLCCSREVVDNTKSFLVVRLSCAPNIVTELSRLMGGSDDQEEPTAVVSGIYGLYNTSLRLSFRQFNCLYPEFCEFKLFRRHEEGSSASPSDLSQDVCEDRRLLWNCSDCTNCPAQFLRRALKGHDIYHVNIRFFLNMNQELSEGQACPSGSDARYSDRVALVKKHTDRLLGRLGDLNGNISAQRYLLPKFHFQYRECIRFLRDLVRTYSPLGAQLDSFVDWHILVRNMDILLDSVQYYLDCIREGVTPYGDVTTFAHNLISDLVNGIESINIFNKLAQGINQHSITAPNYEIQTRLNVQKMMIAHSEYVHTLARAQYECNRKLNDKKGEVPHQFVPAVVPQFSTWSVDARVILPYELDWRKHPDTTEKLSLPDKHLIMIHVSSFEYLLRLFDTIPLLNHELYHYARYLNREKRNEYIIRLALLTVAERMARRFAGRVAPGIPLMKTNHELRDIIHSIADCLQNYYEKFEEGENSAWKNLSYWIIKQDVIEVLRKTVAIPEITEYAGEDLAKSADTFFRVFESYSDLHEQSPKRREVYLKFLAYTGDTDTTAFLREAFDALPNDFKQYVSDNNEDAWICLLDKLQGHPRDIPHYRLRMAYSLVTMAACEQIRAFNELSGVHRVFLAAAIKELLLSVPSSEEIENEELYATLIHAVLDNPPLLFYKTLTKLRERSKRQEKDIDTDLCSFSIALEDLNGALFLYSAVFEETETRPTSFDIKLAESLREMLANKLNSNPESSLFSRRSNRLFNVLHSSLVEQQKKVHTWLGLTYFELVDTVNVVFETYSEGCADISMCAMLGLDAFGYLNLMASRFMSSSDPEPGNESVYRRTMLVLSTLSEYTRRDEDILLDFSPLISKFKLNAENFCQRLASEIMRGLSESFAVEPYCEKWRAGGEDAAKRDTENALQKLQAVFTYLFEFIDQEYPPPFNVMYERDENPELFSVRAFTGFGLHMGLSEDTMSDLLGYALRYPTDLCRRFELSLQFLRHAASQPVLPYDVWENAKAVRESVFENILQNWSPLQKQKQRDVLREIRQFYCEISPQPYDPRHMLDCTLTFIHEYYYENRIRVMKEDLKGDSPGG